MYEIYPLSCGEDCDVPLRGTWVVRSCQPSREPSDMGPHSSPLTTGFLLDEDKLMLPRF